jgi:hypothetical protein
MTCHEIEKRLPAYLEDLVSPADKNDIAGHLSACPHCSKALLDLMQVKKLLQGLEEVEPPPFFEQRIMSQVRQETGQRQGFLRRLFYPLYVKVPIQAMAMVLVAVLGFYVFQKSDPEVKQAVTLPRPMTESTKSELIAESPPAPAVVKPVPPLSNGEIREKRQEKVKDVPVGGAQTAGTIGDKSEKMAADQPSEALAPEHKRQGKAAAPGVLADRDRQISAAPAPSRQKAMAVAKGADMALTISVVDAAVALQQIEERLVQVNGRVVDRKRRDGKLSLNAELPPQHVARFLDQLEGIGRVSLNQKTDAISDRQVTIRIEINVRP